MEELLSEALVQGGAGIAWTSIITTVHAILACPSTRREFDVSVFNFSTVLLEIAAFLDFS